jgi:hypothetical protein
VTLKNDVLRLRSLNETCACVDLMSFEEKSAHEIHEQLVPTIRNVVGLALRVFDDVGRGHDTDVEEADEVRRGERRVQRVADLCFVAQIELSPRQTELDQLDGEDKWTMLSSCYHAFGIIRKSLMAIEPMLARLMGQEPLLTRRKSVDSAVRVRRTYCNFHRQILLGGEPREGNVETRLEQAHDAITRLVASPVYGELRGSDRCQLRRVGDRLAAWLRDEPENRQRAGGIEIWKDLATLSEMMRQINRREELITHDTNQLHVLRRALRRAIDADSEIPQELFPRMRSLEGRDAELDDYLDGSARPNLRVLLSVVERVLEEIDADYDAVIEGALQGVVGGA